MQDKQDWKETLSALLVTIFGLGCALGGCLIQIGLWVIGGLGLTLLSPDTKLFRMQLKCL